MTTAVIRDDRPRWRRSPALRVAVLVAVAVTLLVGGLFLSRRDGQRMQQALTQTQLEAQAAGPGIDLDAVNRAIGVPGGADALVPTLPGADRMTYQLATGPPRQLIVDYQVERGGRTACVRLVRTADATDVATDGVRCSDAFPGGG